MAEPTAPDFTWDAGRRQFREPRSGKFVARAAVRKSLDRVLDKASAEARQLAQSLANGEIELAFFEKQLKALTKNAVVASGIVGAGGKANLTPAILGKLGSLTKFQFGYVSSLAREIDAGLPLDGNFLARVAMYPLAGTGAYEAVLRAGDIAAGFDEERRRLNSAESCPECREYASRGWQPAGELPGVGEKCSCKTRCRCTMSRRRPGKATMSALDRFRTRLASSAARFAALAVPMPPPTSWTPLVAFARGGGGKASAGTKDDAGPGKAGKGKGKAGGKLHGAGNCGSGKGGFKPGNTCGKGGRAKLAANLRAARATAGDHHEHAALRDKAKALKLHRRGHDHAVADEHAGQLRASLRTTGKQTRIKAETVAVAKAEVKAAHSVQRARNARDAARKPVHESPRPEPGLINAYRKDVQKYKDRKAEDEKIVAERGHELDAAKAKRQQLADKMYDFSVSARTRKNYEKKFKEHDEHYQKLDDEIGSARYRLEQGINERFQARSQERLDQMLAEHSAKGPERFHYAEHQANHPDLIPPGPIAERIGKYRVGAAKVKAIDAIGAHYEAKDAELAIERTRLHKEMAGHMDRQASHIESDPELSPATHAKVDAAQAKIDQLSVEIDRVKSQQKSLAARKRDDVEAVLRVDRPVKFETSDVPAGFNTDSGPLRPLTAYNQEGLARAHHFLGRTVARGDEDAVRVAFGEGPRYRAHYSGGDRPHIQIETGEDVSTIVHEYGHAIDHQVSIGGRRANASSQQFLKHRVGDEPLVDLHQKFQAGDPGEMGRPDKFHAATGSDYRAHYTGKDYGGGSSEITSMGMEHLHRDPVKFVRADPEFARHIFGILDGSLR